MYNRCIFINREFGNNRVSRFPGQIREFGQVDRRSCYPSGHRREWAGRGGRELRCGSVPQQKFITNGVESLTLRDNVFDDNLIHLSVDWHRISD